MPTSKIEELANWYFRLNGCLSIPNFVVHPEIGNNQCTEADVLAVRFPYRDERAKVVLKDDIHFTQEGTRLQFFIVEAKSGPCALNGPYTRPESKNLQKIIRSIGFAPAADVDCIADSIYRVGYYSNHVLVARLFCIGKRRADLGGNYSSVPQVSHDEVLRFIYDRFRKNKKAKASHPQWDAVGQELFTLAVKTSTAESFCSKAVDYLSERNSRT